MSRLKVILRVLLLAVITLGAASASRLGGEPVSLTGAVSDSRLVTSKPQNLGLSANPSSDHVPAHFGQKQTGLAPGNSPLGVPTPVDQAPLANADWPQVTQTYDGSGQVVEPSIVYFPQGWGGWEYWLVVTPYPGGNEHKENPSILVSHDGVLWQTPAGIRNPIVLPSTSHLADPNLIYDPASDRLWVYYLHQMVNGRTVIMRKTSLDGVHWGTRQENLNEALFSMPDNQFLSPTVLKVGPTYRMWSVNAGWGGCLSLAARIQYQTSTDGVHWSIPVDTDFAQDGYLPWHINVIYVPSKDEYWMLVAAMRWGTSCSHAELFFARSVDGINWTTYARPALRPGTGLAWDRGEIYRSTLLYDAQNDLLRVWYSASDGEHWHLGYTESNYTEFLNGLLGPAQSPTSARAGGKAGPSGLTAVSAVPPTVTKVHSRAFP